MNRFKIRWISFSLCALAITLASTIFHYGQEQAYEQTINNMYARAYYLFTQSIEGVDSSLEKGIHSNSPSYFISFASQIWKETGSAKAALAQLPLDAHEMEQCYEFLSKTGDYANTLLKKVVEEGEITQEERETLEFLSSYAKELNASLSNVSASIHSQETPSSWNTLSLPTFSFKTSLEGEEKKGEEVSALVYDGPFSDHLKTLEPQFLKNKEPVSMEEAKEKAATLLNLPKDSLLVEKRQNGTLEAYAFFVFEEENSSVLELSVLGGVPLYLLCQTTVTTPLLSHEEAVEKGREKLESLGFSSMKESYFMESDGVLTIHFASLQEAYTCYGDLITIGIALDTGNMVFLDTHNYITNHIAYRSIPIPALSIEEAKKNLSPNLSPISQFFAMIPTTYGTEIPVFAFECTNHDNRRFLVFLNTQTGKEEKIVLLIDSSSGTLVV